MAPTAAGMVAQWDRLQHSGGAYIYREMTFAELFEFNAEIPQE